MRSLFFTTIFVLLASAMMAGPNGSFTLHTVEKGETLYSISKQFGIKPQDIAKFNDEVGDKLTIHVGQKLKIPVTPATNEADKNESPAVGKTSTESAQADASESYHTVAKGETVFSIAKKYEVQRSDLMAWNHIKDNNISIGQKLLVKNAGNASANVEKVTAPATGNKTTATAKNYSKNDVEDAMKKDGYTWTLPADGKEPKTNVSTASGDVTASATGGGLPDTRIIKTWKVESTSERSEFAHPKAAYDPATDYESLYYQNVYSGMTKKAETGVAKFLIDNNNSNTAYYNNASVGTILKLTNPNNGKTTYAIVVGKIPQAEENSVLMKLSNRVAKTLNAKDYSSVEVVCYTGN